MRPALLLPLFLAACVGNLSGEDRITATLAGRTVSFAGPGATKETGFWQEWRADGTTRTGAPDTVFLNKSGRWTVVRGTYCEIFGSAVEWTCWRITLSQGGRAIRFWEIPDDPAGLLLFHRDMDGWFID